jgi:hypothetical protein
MHKKSLQTLNPMTTAVSQLVYTTCPLQPPEMRMGMGSSVVLTGCDHLNDRRAGVEIALLVLNTNLLCPSTHWLC